MCGFAGFLSPTPLPSEAQNLLKRMTDALAHRGPDDEGQWLESEGGIALGHRRLAIVDLSPAGHQPMTSASGRFVMVFNGEIYNHEEIRATLDAQGKAPPYRGHSDTETLLAGFDALGIQNTIALARGMFAIALWDRQDRRLFLIRDRMGEKPLYYGWQRRDGASVFLFGSELSALRVHPSFEGAIDREALCLLLRHSAIGGEGSLYRGIKKLAPGCWLSLSLENPEPKITRFWSVAQTAQSGHAHPFTGTPEEAASALKLLLKDAVRSQMMADVPLGAFLSGGIDSSLIVALMQDLSSKPVKTFSIGFQEGDFDEAGQAREVARRLGTQHTELYVTGKEAQEVIPALPRLYSEPFADSSQIPTFLVARLARESVAVSLSGDGGDELFGGYNRYALTRSLWPALEKTPQLLRRVAASALRAVPPAAWDRGAAGLRALGLSPWAQVGDKIHKGAAMMAAPSLQALYRAMTSQWEDPTRIVVGGEERPLVPADQGALLDGLEPLQKMMALDMMTYLPDDILAKVDRAAMAVSLETRVPFLDPRVVTFALELPVSYKLREGVTKWPLRRLLYDYLPPSLMDQPKRGFAVPLAAWLRGPLRPWAEALLEEGRLRREGFFHPEPLRKKWQEHQSGRRNWAHALWTVLMFQAWHENVRP